MLGVLTTTSGVTNDNCAEKILSFVTLNLLKLLFYFIMQCLFFLKRPFRKTPICNNLALIIMVMKQSQFI